MSTNARFSLRRGSVDRALVWTPLPTIWRFRSRAKVAVLTYHNITDASLFRTHLEFVRQHMNPIGLNDLLGAIRKDVRLPRDSVLVTFDDGDRSIVDVAAPLLQSFGIPAVVFAVVGVIETRAPYWWDETTRLVEAGAELPESSPDAVSLIRYMKRCADEERLALLHALRSSVPDADTTTVSQLRSDELRALERMGVEMASHTMTHPCLPRCSDEKTLDEIENSHWLLARMLGHQPRAFAYPNGDWDPRVERVLADLGYEAAFLFDHRLVDPRNTHPLRISRVRVDAGASIDRFRIITSGLHPAIHRLRGLD